MKKPLLTKRQRALQELEHASQSLNHALSLLGGRTRHKPRKITREFTSRQYLEGIINRLRVVNDLLTIGASFEWVVEGTIPPKADSLGAISPAFPRDDFEAAYDKERKPQC